MTPEQQKAVEELRKDFGIMRRGYLSNKVKAVIALLEQAQRERDEALQDRHEALAMQQAEQRNHLKERDDLQAKLDALMKCIHKIRKNCDDDFSDSAVLDDVTSDLENLIYDYEHEETRFSKERLKTKEIQDTPDASSTIQSIGPGTTNGPGTSIPPEDVGLLKEIQAKLLAEQAAGAAMRKQHEEVLEVAWMLDNEEQHQTRATQKVLADSCGKSFLAERERMITELKWHWIDGECYCLDKNSGGHSGSYGSICAHCTTGALLKELGWNGDVTSLRKETK